MLLHIPVLVGKIKAIFQKLYNKPCKLTSILQGGKEILFKTLKQSYLKTSFQSLAIRL